MASADLRRLWKLHLIDAAIQDIRNRAAHLDIGQKAAKEVEALEKELAGTDSKVLGGELQDLELKQKGLADKIAKIEKELYGGKIVNPREVENFEKEIEMLRKQRSDLDERIMELWELTPPAKAAAAKLEAEIAAKKKEVAEMRQKAVAVKTQLEADFKTKMAERPALVKEINPLLLAKYEAIAKGHEGVGMAEIIKRRQCGGCGMLLAERTLTMVADDKVVTCESCHRILYYTEGVV